MKYLLPIFFLFVQMSPVNHHVNGSWDTHAGEVASYTLSATVICSSNQAEAQKIIDFNSKNHWTSGAPLPVGFITRKDLNIFLDKGNQYFAAKAVDQPERMTDGDLGTAGTVNPHGNKARMALTFSQPKRIFSISMKYEAKSDIELRIKAKDEAPQSVRIFPATKNYQVVRMEIRADVEQLSLVSKKAFSIFEIAALDSLPREFAVVDLGKSVPVGTIYTRHWPGDDNVTISRLLVSNDGKHWQLAGTLAPENVYTYVTNIIPERPVRYIKLEHTLKAKDWNKAMIWEIQAFDRYGHFGAPPKAVAGSVTMAEMMGVNAIWGWGHNEYSDKIPKGEGIDLYTPFCSHARSYHDMSWEVKAPGEEVDYDKMAAGKGTPAMWWLNWDREYKVWNDRGMDVEATIQIHHFTDKDWKDPYKSAYRYGYNFARHFGSTYGNGLVCTMEIGNEPWKYEASTYRKILEGMSKGAKAGDPAMEVFPCALQSADPDMEQTDVFKNYMGVRLSQKAAPYLDGINVHFYSYIRGVFGKQKAVHPEHPNSNFRAIFNDIRFRDKNLPGKKIYLTEWGWDYPGAGADCTHAECVSEREASVYSIRAALFAMRLRIDRAMWYFYADENKPSSIFARSGLTTSSKSGFKKKGVYYSLMNLVQELHDNYFLDILQEDPQAWIYLFGDKDGNPTHIVAWRPVDGNDESKVTVSLKTNLVIKNAFELAKQKRGVISIPLPEKEGENWKLTIGTTPVFFEVGE